MKHVAPAPVVTYDPPAPVIGFVTKAPGRHFANVATQTFNDSAIESSALVMESVATDVAALCAAPAPVSDHVASALAVTITTPTPAIGYMAVSSAVANDGPLPMIGDVAPTTPAPVIENMAISPVSEFMALALGASDDGPASEIDDLTRCLNDLKKQGIYHPLIPDLESGVAALRQAGGHRLMWTVFEMACC